MNHFIENYSSFHVTRALNGGNGVPYQKTEHELMTVKKGLVRIGANCGPPCRRVSRFL